VAVWAHRENVFPAEIENRLFEHPSVAQVAVVGVPDPHRGEQVAAVVQPADPRADVDPSALSAFCREALAGHETPRLWFVARELPMTGSGKIQKYVLREQIASGALQPIEA
jgi:acyl-CoA synthetase (AMP-forming)/AMP-acid ligase II